MAETMADMMTAKASGEPAACAGQARGRYAAGTEQIRFGYVTRAPGEHVGDPMGTESTRARYASRYTGVTRHVTRALLRGHTLVIWLTLSRLTPVSVPSEKLLCLPEPLMPMKG